MKRIELNCAGCDLEIGDERDADGDVPIVLESDYSRVEAPLDREGALTIIEHLMKVFEL